MDNGKSVPIAATGSGRPPVQRLAYSPEEAALALHLSLATIYRMVYDGRLPSRRTGGRRSRIIIPAKALEEWLESGDEAAGVKAKRRNSQVAKEAVQKLRAAR